MGVWCKAPNGVYAIYVNPSFVNGGSGILGFKVGGARWAKDGWAALRGMKMNRGETLNRISVCFSILCVMFVGGLRPCEGHPDSDSESLEVVFTKWVDHREH